MDTVYGTKKYFQSLSAGTSDLYRTQTCRTVTNDYTYQNTLGRRSQLGAYYHMHKQPSYNEHSLTSQYGYNTWGVWRDGRNIAPSTFSTKTHTHYQKTRSFSIILTTAAFIVLLAVVSIAGLAFYFSSIKANMEDPVLGFEGSFRIAKGDLFSTGLKYNHTTTYKQKIDFYKRFVERALTDNGLQTLRTDIWGFGDGPLIKVSFRIFLDVRKLPQNVHSVEDYIKESLFLETTATKSLYKSLRIDAESMEIKRILDEQVVKSASFYKDAQTMPTSQTQLEKRLMKKGGTTPSLVNKPTTTAKPRVTTRPHSVDDEPDVDVENAPVIQGSFEGSFEITKTDADIARKKVPPTKAYSSFPPKAVTPFSLRVKPKKPSIEKLTTIVPHQQPTKATSTSTTTTTSTTPSTTKTTTTTSTTTTTTTTPKPTTTTTTTTTTPAPITTTTVAASTPTLTTSTYMPPKKHGYPNPFTFPTITTPPATLTVPKLDANLFTSIPILDTAPWRPIHREVPELIPGPPPAFPTKTLPTLKVPPVESEQPPLPQDIPQRRIDEFELPFLPDHGVPVEDPIPAPVPPAFDPYAPNFFGTALRKPENADEPMKAQDMMFYHSFGNPVFMPGEEGIERLGAGAHVQPHPLPVPLIDDVVVPPFRPLTPTLGTSEKLPFDIEAGDEKFEHLGGGVIVKKHEINTSAESTVEVTTPMSSSSTTQAEKILNPAVKLEKPTKPSKPVNQVTLANSELAETIGEFFMDLLKLPKEEGNISSTEPSTSPPPPPPPPAESRIESEEVTTIPAITEKSASVDENLPIMTTKPNFLNLKEIILQRNKLANQSKPILASDADTEIPTTTPTTTTSTSKTTTSPTTTFAPFLYTTKRNRIRPTHHKPPTILDDSILFPSHSKWEFVNSSATDNFGHTGNMRKVFNKTLQAWVSEDVEKTENLTLSDIKTRINNASNIQDISLIFDTLASKLGITPSVPTKVPPFSQNKIKHTQKNENKPKPTTTNMPTTHSTLVSTTHASSSSTTSKEYIELPPIQHEPFIKPMSSFMEDSSEGVGAAIPVVGEAEVEVIDPNRYDEILKSSQFAAATTTETTPKLVTLMPVRSNSGIRTYRPSESVDTARSSNTAPTAAIKPATDLITAGDIRKSIKRKTNIQSQSRRFPPAEAVVKGGLKVNVK